MVQQIENASEQRPHHHRTERDDQSDCRTELREQRARHKARRQRSGHRHIAARQHAVQDENNAEATCIRQQHPADGHHQKISRHGDDSAADRVKTVCNRSERITQQHGNQIGDDKIQAVLPHIDAELLGVLDRKEVDRHENDHPQRDGEHVPAIIRQFKTLPQVGDRRTHDPKQHGLPAGGGSRLLRRRRIFPLLHFEAEQQQPEQIERSDAEENLRRMRFHPVDQPAVVENARPEADYAEEPEETADQFQRNHVVDQCIEQRAGERGPEIQQDPCRAEEEQHPGMFRNRRNRAVQPAAQHPGKSEQIEPQHDERRREHQERNSPPPPPAVTVRNVTDRG